MIMQEETKETFTSPSIEESKGDYKDVIANAESIVESPDSNEKPKEKTDSNDKRGKSTEVSKDEAEDKQSEADDNGTEAKETGENDGKFLKPRISELREARIKALKEELKAIKEERNQLRNSNDEISKRLVERHERDLSDKIYKASVEHFFESAKEEVPDMEQYQWLFRRYSDDLSSSRDFDRIIKNCKYPHGVNYLLMEALDAYNIDPKVFLNRSPGALKRDIQDIEKEYIDTVVKPRAQAQQARPTYNPQYEEPKAQKPMKTIKAETNGGDSNDSQPVDIDKLSLKELVNEVRKGGSRLK